MVQTYNPPLMDVNAETPPELQPVFSLLNSHSNKLYQEGYFLKLDDQNTRTHQSQSLLHLHARCPVATFSAFVAQTQTRAPSLTAEDAQ
jgi:hypothetical protein